MKYIKYKKHIFTVIIALFLSACNKEFLNIVPQDQLTTDNFYQNETQIKAATASLYGAPWYDFAHRFFWLAGDEMAGNIYYTYTAEGQYFYFTFNEGNAFLSESWNSLYRVVSYANDIMYTMPPIASKAGVSQTVINQALGEAHFMRASAYYMLSEFWGEVPVVENNSLIITSNNTNIPKNTKASVYELMRRDLEFAAENLPTSDAAGRVTQWSAKGMLAKLYVTMAQNLSDPNSSQYFDKAKSYSADVITNSGYKLLPNYADLFKIENNNNSESLFALQWIAGNYGTGNGVATDWARNSIIAGITSAYGSGKSISYDFVQSMEPSDLRRTSIYMTKGDYYPEIRKSKGGYHYNYVTLDDKGQQIETAGPVLNSIKKYVIGSAEDTNNQVVANGTGQNQYILRLADLYLIYAEAALGSGSSTSDELALGYFNTIRDRAGLPHKTSLTFNDILKERRVEFAGEMMYWFDLKRFFYRAPDEALANINGQARAYTYNYNGTGDANEISSYTLTPPTTPIIANASQMVLPIPASEVGYNPMMSPNEKAVEYVFNK